MLISLNIYKGNITKQEWGSTKIRKSNGLGQWVCDSKRAFIVFELLLQNSAVAVL